jgi:outer membrane receptor for ferrienterochelin and colicins
VTGLLFLFNYKFKQLPIRSFNITRCFPRRIVQLSLLSLAIASASQALAQDQIETSIEALEDSTIVYEASFFKQYSPVSVNDMIDRIPGISLALNRGGGRGNRRGLGAGANEILINGQRITGKENAGRAQLSRISANQVQYIEIIRGTSDELDVRGGGQVVNIVLLETPSRSSISAEVNMDRLQDGTVDPGAKLSYSGQTGAFNYLFHVETEPRYENRESFESSRDFSGALLETRRENREREQNEFETSFNLGYQFENSIVQFNGLYGDSAPRTDLDRSIDGFAVGTVLPSLERETNDSERSNWEIGGDYEYRFSNGSKYRVLFIVNERESEFARDRYLVGATEEEKDLFLFSSGRDQERIVRTSYTWDLARNQGFEIGVERAQTIRDNGLRLGLPGTGETSPAHGGLVPVQIDNAFSSIEEIRYENFVAHNWQLNSRMALESSLIYEVSTITQSGDVTNERDFDFVRPKVDYRFDITESLQFRATIEKNVSQLSFSDFSSSSDNSDDNQNIQAGNPDITQEQSWNYSLNLEYRLPNNIGVLNSSVFYRDIEDYIDRVDVSTSADDLQSARGNIGDGKRYGLNLDASTRLGYLGVPDALLSIGFGLQDSEVRDPFLGVDRRMRHNNRWFGRANFRHDITAWGLSYGFSYFNSAQDGSSRTTVDIKDIERDLGDYGLSGFIEKKAFGGMTFRFAMQNANDSQRCRERVRFSGTTAAGIVEEIEDFCSSTGIKYALKIRHTF